MSVFAFLEKHKASCAVAVFALLLLVNGAFLSVYNNRYFHVSSKALFALTALCAIFFIAAYLLWKLMGKRNERKATNIVFLLSMLVAGLVSMAVFTPLSVPDEAFHYHWTYRVSDMFMGCDYDDKTLEMRDCDADFILDFSTRVDAHEYGEIRENISLFADDLSTSVVDIPSGVVAENPIQVRIIAALGITLGRLLHLSPLITFYLGRLFNLLLYIGLVYLALRVTPVARKAFMAVALLPMSLHLAASYSYDASIIGLAFLLTALCLKSIYAEGKMRVSEMLLIALVTFLIAPCKVVYTALAGLVFFIPNKRFKSRGVALLFKLGICAVGVVGILVTRLSMLMHVLGLGAAEAADAAGGEGQLGERLGEIGVYYSVSYALNHLVDTIFVCVNTLFTRGDFYIMTLVGASLGCFQGELVAPWIITLSLYTFLALGMVRDNEDESVPSGGLRLWSLVIIAAITAAVFASMLFGWTFITEQTINGVQGRYFLPFLPLLLFVVRPRALVAKVSLEGLIVFGMTYVNLCYFLYIFARAICIQ